MTAPLLAPKNWRALRRALRALGAKSVRTKGSHETWRFDDGATFVVVRNHLADAVPTSIRHRFRRLCEQRCADAGEEPPPLGGRDHRDPVPVSSDSKTRSASCVKEAAAV